MISRKRAWWQLLPALLLGAGIALLSRSPLSAQGPELFTGSVVPVLQGRCVQCHNGQKSRGGLNLTSRRFLLRGGDNGPAIIPGNSAASLLVQMVTGAEPRMPKQGTHLASKEIADIRNWIDRGAIWPDQVTLAEPKNRWRVGPDWWSLRKLERSKIPTVREMDWVRNPIDAFVLAKLEGKGLHPSRPAEKRTLIRRVSYDLLGLPPSPAEVDAFVSDDSPDVYERLVERLLASPHYGERWGRHWLDVVHYGDTHGYDKDKRRDHAWPYRDYVIRSLNADKAYERFAREQIAGDVLFPQDPNATIATGFIAAGPWDFVGQVELAEGTVEKDKTRLIDRDDMVGTTIMTFLSLTIQCARCHDHKFDPIPKKEYYRLQAVFAGLDRGERPVPRKPTRGSEAKGTVYAVVSHAPRPVYDLNRGDVQQKGDEVQPGALSCLTGLSPDFGALDPKDEECRRAKLAQWITNAKNALTWRSIVNRIWHYHFGRGIVDTPNDFGWNGGRPTHPELLDWLACEFLEHGQSIKALHRMILLSATYRQSSENDAQCAHIDTENRYLWRMNRRRLDAESLRDAVLALSGALDRRMGGPGLELFRFKDDHSPVYDHSALDKINDPRTWRRTVYRFTVRSVPNPFLDCLDCADPNLNTPARNTTITALQALALWNDPFILKQSELLAEQLREIEPDLPRQIEAAYKRVLGRKPKADERDTLFGYATDHGLANLSRVLLNTNEFVFVD
jgi:hypothetical protein